MCRSVANQTRCAQTVVYDFIDRANDFLNAGFIRPFERSVLYGSLVVFITAIAILEWSCDR
jgi:hypothetical protein